MEIGGRELEASAGDTVFKPRGVAHAFWNASERPVRLLEIISPARFADYFRDMTRVFADPAAMEEVRARYELEMDLASVPELVQRHGLDVPVPGPPPRTAAARTGRARASRASREPAPARERRQTVAMLSSSADARAQGSAAPAPRKAA